MPVIGEMKTGLLDTTQWKLEEIEDCCQDSGFGLLFSTRN